MKISSLPRKVRRNVQDCGLLTTFKKAVQYLFSAIYEQRVYRLYKIDTALDRKGGEIDQKITFRWLRETDDDLIRQIVRMAEWFAGELKPKISKGSLCLVAVDGPKVAGFNLVSTGQVYIPLIRKARTFRPNQAWSEHIAVHKDYRRMGLGSELRARILRELKARAIRRLYGGTLVSNEAALKLTRSVGFVEFVDVHYKRALGRELWRYQKVRR